MTDPADRGVDPDTLRRAARPRAATVRDGASTHRSWWLRGALVVLVLLLAVLAFQVTRTVLALRDAERQADAARAELIDLDVPAAQETVESLRQSTETARRSSDGLLWAATTVLPFVGDDMAAVRDLSAALDTVAQAAPAGLQAVAEVQRSDLRTDDGGIDLDLVSALQPELEQLAGATESASESVADVDPDRLVGRLAAPARSFLEELEQLRVGASGAATAAEVLPAVLGVDGPRRYLLVAQNNAEVRATGGLPGSASIVTADDGAIDLGFQGNAGDVTGTGTGNRRPVADFLPGEEQVFGPLLVSDFRDTNFTPDFPRAASLMAAFAQRTRDEAVDGVISVDPVLLSRVLGATGPVEVEGQRIDADNAVRQLLLESYLRLPDPNAQDAFFRVAARNILTALLSDTGDQTALVRTLGEGITQRRLLFWSADPALQERLAGTSVAGALPGDTGRPEVGLYLNDGTQAKMQYFLRSDADLVSEGCDAEGRQLVRARLTLTNDVTLPVDQLPDYVTGGGRVVPRGVSLMQLRMFAPVGGELVGLEVDGERTEVGQGEVYGRQVTQTRVELAPGESTEIVAQFVGREGERGNPRLEWTPGIEWGPTRQVVPSGCGAA